MREYPPAEARRIVQPRKQNHDYRPIIAISNELVMVETAQEQVFPIDELPAILKAQPSSILAVQGFGSHLQRLQRVYESDPEFTYRITPIRRRPRPWDDGKRVEQGVIVDSLCNYVGWQAKGGKASKGNPNRYHYPLDPLWFLTTSIDDIRDTTEPRLAKLYLWAEEVRFWCRENNLQVKASAGGLAAQLLRDSRFYPEARRKSPRLINDIARYRLPGNYYRLHGETGRYYAATYLDMENAHHAMAKDIEFPCVNRLHAFGDWSHMARIGTADPQKPMPSPRPFADGNSPLLSRPGLHHVRISVPLMRPDRFPPPHMEKPGQHDCFLYSNELQLVRELGGRIECLYASYCSDEIDKGLNRYARFAIEQIKARREFKPWLKPVLHSTYGLLAARPVPFETGYLRAKHGERSEYHMANVTLPVMVTKRPKEVESQIVNVIHRGMIEAAVRAEALTLARELTEQDGQNVLAVYADAIFVESIGKPMRLLRPPWRISKEVTHLMFHSAVHFTSPQLSRLPGVPRTARERYKQEVELVSHLNRLRSRNAS